MGTYIIMKVEGLKGCFEKTHGVFYFAKMCSKIRLHAESKLPRDYHEELGQGSMAEHSGIWASSMRMSEHRCFLERLTGKISTGAVPRERGVKQN